MEFIEIGKRADAIAGKESSPEKAALACRTAAQHLSRLPVLNVEPELMDVVGRIRKHLAEMAHTYDRIAMRNDTGYVVGKMIESFVRGLMLDPLGTTKEELAAARNDMARLDEITQAIRQNIADMNTLRVSLTRKYGVEFPPLNHW
jgi:hypothetical protein